jgi:hypothetical protein
LLLFWSLALQCAFSLGDAEVKGALGQRQRGDGDQVWVYSGKVLGRAVGESAIQHGFALLSG